MKLMDLNTFRLTYLFVVNLVILVVSLKFVVAASNSKRESQIFTFSLGIFLLSFLPLQVLAEIGSGKIYMSKSFLSLPVYIFIYYDLFLCSLEYLFFSKFFKTQNTSIGKNSVKESMDNLPDGICFSKADGTPLLVNRQMQEISYEVFGRMLVNDVVCAKEVRNNKIKIPTKILQRDPLVIESKGKVWLIKFILHENFRETLAYNITLEWSMYKEIESKTSQIQRINESLKDYQKNVVEYTRQKEILQAKIKIHDKIGQSLIYFRRYLKKNKKTKEDRHMLIKLWMESLLILDEKIDEKNDFTEENPDTSKNKLLFEKLISAAKDIGVKVHLHGKTPSEERDWILLVDIVHEAINNAIRHGEAKNIWIYLNEDDLNKFLKIENDGLPAHGPIREKGGLKNIRQHIENYGGRMEIKASPKFQLNLSWPKGENYDL